jgi:hypothetical protein
LVRNPYAWSDWLPRIMARAPEGLAKAALRRMTEKGAAAAWAPLVRQLADAAGDVDAFKATFTVAALRDPLAAAEVARRYLAAGGLEEAGRLLQATAPAKGESRGIIGRAPLAAEPDFEWESVWIDYLEQSGKLEAAQAARWASFERTLAPVRARAFTAQLGDFDDVEAEGRAFAHAAAHRDAQLGLAFLMDWPALPEAARMIEARADEIDPAAEQAEQWAAKLRARYPAAAHRLLRRAAAAALRRRDLKTCDRLTQEADAIAL